MSTVYTGPDRLQLDHRQPELARAVRTVDRWGLLAGVIGCLSNVLLVVMFATPADGAYAWTGGANDVTGMVSILAMIPVAAALLAFCGRSPGLGAITSLAIVAMVMIAAVSLLLVLGLVPQSAQTDWSYVSLVFISGWLFAAGRAGRASGRLPRGVAGWGIGLGAAGLAGALLLVASVLVPDGSVVQEILGYAGLLAGGPTGLACPVWLIVLSYRLPGHVTRGGAANRTPVR